MGDDCAAREGGGVMKRSDNLGLPKSVTPKKLASKVRRKVAAIKRMINELGPIFEDIDGCLVQAGDDLAAACDDFEKEVDETLVYWAEEVAE